MKKVILLTMAAALMFLVGCMQQMDLSVKKAKVNTVLDEMIQVLETENIDLLSQIVAHDSDMVCFGTDKAERIVGWEALKAEMEQQFADTENSTLSVKNRLIQVHESGRVAWFSEIIDWHIESQGQLIEIEGLRGTGVLVKRNGEWNIIQLHYSIGVRDNL